MSTGLDQPADPPRARRRPGRPPTLDRDAVLEAAREAIAERGIERTRYADVSTKAGVPVTTLQHAFGSLQSLLLEALQRATARELHYLRGRHLEGSSVWDRMYGFVIDALTTPEEHHAATWLVWIELWRLVARDHEFAVGTRPIYEHWHDYVVELVVAGVESGEFSGPLTADPSRAADAINAVMDGIAINKILRADDALVDVEGAIEIALDAIAVLLGRTPTA